MNLKLALQFQRLYRGLALGQQVHSLEPDGQWKFGPFEDGFSRGAGLRPPVLAVEQAMGEAIVTRGR